MLVLTPLVFVHELGHYIAAIKNNVKVEVFSVGFGKELFGFDDKNNTRWKFCILPFGGYVKMKGELIVNEKNSISKKILMNLKTNQVILIMHHCGQDF